MNKLGTKLGAIAMSAVMALTFAPSAAITSLAADGDDVATTAAVDPGQAIYGLYNPNSGEHLFTANATEAAGLQAAGWQEGDVKWYSPTSGTKVYRLYNPNVVAPDGTPLGDHHYTTNEEEVEKLKTAGWSEDAEFFYAQMTPGEGSVPVYKLYNPNAYKQPKYSGAHHFTLDEKEKDDLLKAGWTEGDVAFYTLGKEKPVVAKYTVSIDDTTPNVGDTLRALIYDEEGNEVNPDDVDAEIQWSADGVEISDATAAEYTVVVDDAGVVLSVEVTIGDETYTAETEKVEAGEEPIEELTVSIDNPSPKVGDTLTATVVDRNGEDVSDNVTFQWYADDVAIEGADEETLVVDADLLGAALKVVVTAENGNTFESDPTAEVEAAEEALYTVLIDDTTPVVGQTLTAIILDAEGEEVEDTSDFAYQWYADGEKIRGEKDAELYVDDDLLGSVLSVVVYDADDNEYASEETEEVVDADEAYTVAIDNKTPKVGDTITVEIEDAEGNEVDPEDAAIQWYTNGVEISGATSAEYTVISGDAGATLSVVVTIDGVEYDDATEPVAGEDKSTEVELVDEYGLQSDGTGIVGDKLTVTYGADFGTPTNISWYKNGKVVLTNSVGDNVNTGLSITIPAGGRFGVGTYKVTITNTEGEMATTNEIVITDKEEAAEILEFTLEDDYTDGTDLIYLPTDTKAIATVTLDKNYQGKIGIYKATDKSFTDVIDTLDTNIEEPYVTIADAIKATNGTVWTAIADGKSILTTNKPTNFNVENAANQGSGYGFINDDGTVTYKFVVNTKGLLRGENYVVTFDQDSITTDKPGAGTANTFAEAVAAPYIKTPATIAVTKVSNGNKPEVTFYDETGSVSGWFGVPATVIPGKDTLAKCGIDSAEIYKATAKVNDPSASVASKIGTAKTDSLSKGVWTSSVKADKTAFWFAQVKTTKGVFGKDSVTLTSEAVAVAQNSASDMDLVQDGTTATTATVKFSNLRADGTVYIVRGSYVDKANGTIGSDAYTTTALIFDKFNKDDATTYTASTTVSAGAEKVDIPSALGAITGKTNASIAATPATDTDVNTDQYIAVFIPDDEVNYGMIYTDGAIATDGTTMGHNDKAGTAGTSDVPVMSGLYVSAKETTYSMTKKEYTSGNSFDITVKDQFGNNMTITDGKYNYKMETADESKTPFTATANIANTGKLSIKSVGNKLGFIATAQGTLDEVNYLRLGGNYYLVAKCTNAGSGTADSKWEMSVQEYTTSPVKDGTQDAAAQTPATATATSVRDSSGAVVTTLSVTASAIADITAGVTTNVYLYDQYGQVMKNVTPAGTVAIASGTDAGGKTIDFGSDANGKLIVKSSAGLTPNATDVVTATYGCTVTITVPAA